MEEENVSTSPEETKDRKISFKVISDEIDPSTRNVNTSIAKARDSVKMAKVVITGIEGLLAPPLKRKSSTAIEGSKGKRQSAMRQSLASTASAYDEPGTKSEDPQSRIKSIHSKSLQDKMDSGPVHTGISFVEPEETKEKKRVKIASVVVMDDVPDLEARRESTYVEDGTVKSILKGGVLQTDTEEDVVSEESEDKTAVVVEWDDDFGTHAEHDYAFEEMALEQHSDLSSSEDSSIGCRPPRSRDTKRILSRVSLIPHKLTDRYPRLKEPYIRCSALEAAAYNCLLEHTIDELYILSSHDISPNPPLENLQLTIKFRFGETISRKKVFDAETLETTERALDRHRKCKVQRDRNFFKDILEKTTQDLKYDGAFPLLRECVWLSVKKFHDEAELIKVSAENEEKVIVLTKLMADEKIAAEEKIKQQDMDIVRLQLEVHDTILITECMKRRVNNWELARLEQLLYILETKETGLIEDKERFLLLIEREDRVDEESSAYLVQLEKELKVMVNEWMVKYEDDIERLDTELVLWRDKGKDMKEQRQYKQKHFDSRQKEIDEYKVVREEREEMRKYNVAATKIQAWWRGMMYRHKLGKYRKKRKGKKGKKGRKGRKGKKGKKGKKSKKFKY